MIIYSCLTIKLTLLKTLNFHYWHLFRVLQLSAKGAKQIEIMIIFDQGSGPQKITIILKLLEKNIIM